MDKSVIVVGTILALALVTACLSIPQKSRQVRLAQQVLLKDYPYVECQLLSDKQVKAIYEIRLTGKGQLLPTAKRVNEYCEDIK